MVRSFATVRARQWLGSLLEVPPPDVAGHHARTSGLFTYLLLGLGTLVSALSQSLFTRPWQNIPVLLGLAVLTLAWVWWWTAHPGRLASSTRVGIYYGGRTVLALVLTLVNPFAAIFAFVGYLDLEVFGRRGRRLGLVATALIMAGSQAGGLPPVSVGQGLLWAVLFVLNAGLASALLRINDRQGELSAERAETIAQLEETNARLGDALAENAALQVQLLVQAREAGVLDERQRLAREIHDTIAQGLAGIITQLQAADECPDPVQARDHRERAAALARVSLDEARRSVHDLTPRELDHDNLPAALQRLVSAWSQSSGVTAHVEVTGGWQALHDEVESTLIRVAQESLANVGKHAGATLVVVTLSAMDDVVTLDVRDDGRGFEPGELPAPGSRGGFGVPGMRHRAQRLAGALAVESEPGHGTAVSVRLPALARASDDRLKAASHELSAFSAPATPRADR